MTDAEFERIEQRLFMDGPEEYAAFAAEARRLRNKEADLQAARQDAAHMMHDANRVLDQRKENQ